MSLSHIRVSPTLSPRRMRLRLPPTLRDDILPNGSKATSRLTGREINPIKVALESFFGSKYEAGKRTGAWIKVKLHQEQEFVIGGYTEPEGS